MKNTKNKQRNFLKQDVNHENYNTKCRIALYCLQCECPIDIFNDDTRILPPWKTPGHSCLHMASLYENMFVYPRPHSCARNDHTFLDLLPFSLSYPVTVCPVLVHCLRYNSARNYFGLAIHYYTMFEFYFYKRDYRHRWNPCWTPSTTKKSWTEASFLCKIYNATLPILRSKDELDELLTLLKHGNSVPPIEVLFIGLKLSSEVNR